jgi:pimeloyl-ACP methyl ester carboxylesterase
MWSTGRTLASVQRACEARGYATLAPTLPLHPAHASGELAALGQLSLQDYACYLEGKIREARLQAPPVLIGHSMGGLLAQMLAARLPVRAGILLAPAPPAGISPLGRANLWSTRYVFARADFWRRAQMPPDAIADAALFSGVEPERRAELRAGLVPESGRAWSEIVFAWADRRGAAQVNAADVQCPLLVVAGEHDRAIPIGASRKVAARYAHAEMLALPGRGHWFFEEPGADGVFARMLGWLDLVCAVTNESGAPRNLAPRERAGAPAPTVPTAA